ncbi:MAG: glutamate racemase [Flammeovirgaceae bacterium]
MKQTQPIGIFDSGIGGLTLAQAIHKLLPQENLIYFGDTAHLPYGDKSTPAIQAYAVKICDLLIQQNCKLILIACNSASAAAYELIKAYTASKAKVINVIDPVVNYITAHYHAQQIGLIGTRATVKAGTYREKIKKKNSSIKLKSMATPLLAPMIEDGFYHNNVSKVVIHKYLSSSKLKGIQALILACTHYPLIKDDIAVFYQEQAPVDIIDGSSIVAKEVKAYLANHQLLNASSAMPSLKFYVSDYTQSFEASTKIFFGKRVHLEQYKLWE